MPRVTHPVSIGLAAIVVAALAAARPAAASYPCATYVVPSLVELQPSDAGATRVVIHGAFIQLTSETAATYGNPKCGVMYFECVAGQEAMCQMQWLELRDAVSATPHFCEGFGGWNVLSVATVRDEGAPLGAPDTWDLGMGIAQGVYVDNKCPPAMQLVCPASAGDGGVVDAATPIDAAPDAAPDIAPDATPDAAPMDDAAPVTDVAPPTDAAADPKGGSDGSADAGPMLARRSGWCAVAGPTRPSLPAGVLVFGAMVLVRRRQRRAGR
ncbi:MAG TPA: hypothetical protein VN903_23415 [Polyangia bacterium]|jgi:hypothetical protein|nr:hypothetical protein [Polyangia bacterium]